MGKMSILRNNVVTINFDMPLNFHPTLYPQTQPISGMLGGIVSMARKVASCGAGKPIRRPSMSVSSGRGKAGSPGEGAGEGTGKRGGWWKKKRGRKKETVGNGR